MLSRTWSHRIFEEISIQAKSQPLYPSTFISTPLYVFLNSIPGKSPAEQNYLGTYLAFFFSTTDDER